MKYAFLILPGLILLVSLMFLMLTSAVVAELALIRQSKRAPGRRTRL